MPADLLEKAAEVEEPSQEVSTARPVDPRSVSEAGKQKVESPRPTKNLARKIFEGHEEFLGWTPE